MSGPNVGYATLQIIPSARGFQNSLQGQIDPAAGAVGRRGGQTAGRGFSSAFVAPLKGIAGPMAAVFGAQAIGGFLKDTIGQASDLQESGTKLQAIFGDATGQIEAFAGKGAKALGQSNLALKDAAATFGVYGKAAGLAGAENAKFSTDLVGLSTDLASFYNASPEEAVQAIGAALRGEAEPMRRFGVLLDDATLRNRALKMGLVKTTKEALNPQTKALAAQAEILAQTKVAQGDFARTSGGLANQQRILSAQFTNLKGKIGSALLPAVTGAVSGLNGLFDVVGKIGPAVSSLTGEGGRFSGAWTAVVGFVRGQVVPTVQQMGDVFVTRVLPVLRQVGEWLLTRVVPAILATYASIASSLRPILTALFSTIQTQVLPALAGVWAKFQEWLPTIQRVVGVVLTVTSAVLRFAAAVLGKVLPPLIRFAGFLLGNVVGAVSTVIGWVVKIIGKVFDFGAAIGSAVGAVGRFASGVRTKFGEALSFIRGIPGRVRSSLGNLGGTLLSAGSDLVGGFIRGITRKAGDLVAAVKSTITDRLPGFVKKALGIKSPSRVFMALGQHTADGFALGVERGQGRAQRAMAGVVAPPEAPSTRTDASGRPAVGGGALVGALTLQSTGSVRDDLEEALFTLRRIRRGGVYA